MTAGERTNVAGTTSWGNTFRVTFASENTKSVLACGSGKSTVRVRTASKLANSKSANKSRETVAVGSTSNTAETSQTLGVGRTVSVGVTSWKADSVGTSLTGDTAGVFVTSWNTSTVVSTDKVERAVRVGATQVQFDLADSVNTVGAWNETTVGIGTASQDTEVKVGIADKSL